ncbi:TPA: phage tail protein [Vibrio cholerae]
MQKYYANNQSISQSPLKDGIEISAEQYEAAALAKINGQIVDVINGELVIKAPYVKVTAYLKSDCRKQKEFDDVTLVTGDYTLKKPATQFDEWMDGEWVTDVQSQYQWQVNQVSETRYRLYLEVDRLRNEAVSIAETENDLDKAREYKLQADALYLKIRAENPWPVNPEA